MRTQIRAPPSPIFSRRIEDFRHIHGTAIGLIFLRCESPIHAPMRMATALEQGHVAIVCVICNPDAPSWRKRRRSCCVYFRKTGFHVNKYTIWSSLSEMERKPIP